MLDFLEIEIKSLKNRKRLIRIATPKDYEATQTHYPVIYMQDGQNLFDDKTATYGKSWNIKVVDCIIVGIDSGEGYSRLDELSPWLNEEIVNQKAFPIERPCGGEGEAFLDFIVYELKPLIDSTYRTLSDREHTLLAGSSMGGLFSYFGVLRRPDIFSKALCFSSSFWFDEVQVLQLIRAYKGNQSLKIYLDHGVSETANKAMNSYLIDLTNVVNYKLRDKGILSEIILDPNGKHQEASWEKRFPAAYFWIMNEGATHESF